MIQGSTNNNGRFYWVESHLEITKQDLTLAFSTALRKRNLENSTTKYSNCTGAVVGRNNLRSVLFEPQLSVMSHRPGCTAMPLQRPHKFPRVEVDDFHCVVSTTLQENSPF